MEFDSLSNKVLGCAVEVHKFLGPGLLESAYEQCMCYELSKLNLKFECQKPMPVLYKEILLDLGYRIDILVEKELLVELKSVAEILPVHKAQILTYMKFSNIKTGLLLNFNVEYLKKGIKRFVL